MLGVLERVRHLPQPQLLSGEHVKPLGGGIVLVLVFVLFLVAVVITDVLVVITVVVVAVVAALLCRCAALTCVAQERGAKRKDGAERKWTGRKLSWNQVRSTCKIVSKLAWP